MKNLFFDYNATTPVHPLVLEAMAPFWADKFGNPSSANHSYGWEAQAAVDKARGIIAKYLNCKSKEINFTSGATESNNWALRGVIENLRLQDPTGPIHVLISSIEHASVKAPVLHLSKLLNFEFDFIPCDEHGTVLLSKAQELLRSSTKLISCIWVNNETGVIQPIEALGRLARQRGIYFHTDATQAIGKCEMDLAKLPVDLLSFSGHKIYGPKGIGALFIRSTEPHVSICPLLFGGGQENGKRSGTSNVPAIVGLGKCFEILGSAEFKEQSSVVENLREDLEKYILHLLPEAKLNGAKAHRVSNTINLTLPRKLNQSLSLSLGKVAFSSGSACSSGANAGSHVLLAMGLTTEESQNAWRISLGYMTQLPEITQLKELLKNSVDKLRSKDLNLT